MSHDITCLIAFLSSLSYHACITLVSTHFDTPSGSGEWFAHRWDMSNNNVCTRDTRDIYKPRGSRWMHVKSSSAASFMDRPTETYLGRLDHRCLNVIDLFHNGLRASNFGCSFSLILDSFQSQERDSTCWCGVCELHSAMHPTGAPLCLWRSLLSSHSITLRWILCCVTMPII